MSAPVDLHKVLISSGKLAELATRCQSLQTLEGLLHTHLPAPLARHCRVASLDQQTLYLHADTPVWASQLRFHSRQLLADLKRHKDLEQLTQIEIRTVPAPCHATAAL
ncbi:MAG: DUF721 domain-containing protein [Gammaproteobacteria bacterium]|nr:DUF721 domain-containing protein [Gammaproteobacteria bacterium]